MRITSHGTIVIKTTEVRGEPHIRMNTRYVWLLLASFVCGSFGFIGEMLDSIEDIPVRFVSGTCFLLLHKTYDPGEFEMRIRLNKPTIDLYSSDFYSFDRQYHGMTYRIINLIPLKSGLASVRFSVGYFGSRYHSPRSWCERITPVATPTTTVPTPTTTVSVTTTADRATTTTLSTRSPTTSTVSQSTTLTTTVPVPTTPIGQNTTSTTQDTTSTTQDTTSNIQDTTSTPESMTTLPTITTPVFGTSTLGTPPPRPTPA
ncbi:uncharacterized protein LOC143071466 isoform X1 [Mytilus galloprovincialis]|uniref:uncharacterized protein LOC143071466 isoform X1 n=1 Tax=Mytilus galloprovincialis TaxID=29158 RepID=UPI003F7C0C47